MSPGAPVHEGLLFRQDTIAHNVVHQRWARLFRHPAPAVRSVLRRDTARGASQPSSRPRALAAVSQVRKSRTLIGARGAAGAIPRQASRGAQHGRARVLHPARRRASEQRAREDVRRQATRNELAQGLSHGADEGAAAGAPAAAHAASQAHRGRRRRRPAGEICRRHLAPRAFHRARR